MEPTAQFIGVKPKKPEFELMSLNAGKKFVFGRHPDVSCIVKDVNVSRRHAEVACQFNRERTTWFVRDLKSSNGTFVNGSKLTELSPRALCDGDLVRLGPPDSDYLWKFQDSGTSTSTLSGGGVEALADIGGPAVAAAGNDAAEPGDDDPPPDAKRRRVQAAGSDIKEQQRKVEEIATKSREMLAEKESMVEKLRQEKEKIKETLNAEKVKLAEQLEAEKTTIEQRLGAEKIKCEEDMKAFKEAYAATKSASAQNDLEHAAALARLSAQLEERKEQGRREIEEIIAKEKAEKEKMWKKNEEIEKERHEQSKKIEQIEKDNQDKLKEVESMKCEHAAELRRFACELESRAEATRLELEAARAAERAAQAEAAETFRLRAEKEKADARKEVLSDVIGGCEAELSCSVCTDMFITPVSLKCGHVYCEYCFLNWKQTLIKDKKDVICPNCREKVTSEPTRSYHLDNLIDKLLDKPECKEIREVRLRNIQERKGAIKEMTAAAQDATDQGTRQQRRRWLQELQQANHARAQQQSNQARAQEVRSEHVANQARAQQQENRQPGVQQLTNRARALQLAPQVRPENGQQQQQVNQANREEQIPQSRSQQLINEDFQSRVTPNLRRNVGAIDAQVRAFADSSATRYVFPSSLTSRQFVERCAEAHAGVSLALADGHRRLVLLKRRTAAAAPAASAQASDDATPHAPQIAAVGRAAIYQQGRRPPEPAAREYQEIRPPRTFAPAGGYQEIRPPRTFAAAAVLRHTGPLVPVPPPPRGVAVQLLPSVAPVRAAAANGTSAGAAAGRRPPAIRPSATVTSSTATIDLSLDSQEPVVVQHTEPAGRADQPIDLRDDVIAQLVVRPPPPTATTRFQSIVPAAAATVTPVAAGGGTGNAAGERQVIVQQAGLLSALGIRIQLPLTAIESLRPGQSIVPAGTGHTGLLIVKTMAGELKIIANRSVTADGQHPLASACAIMSAVIHALD